eukprot:TRINITY_DN66159_c6_g3_i1.p3 TRINITY_DN66159_c6_g3~~TRINITY_DN66159_c6_g3_i1.p3  ORF type:complete len:291 (+),score=151.88 TRINITY_DN66159_c6_g3_i1:1053-1925(+)
MTTLSYDRYGKVDVRLLRVTRLADRHIIKELSVDVYQEGDFARSFLSGDNSNTVPTDTQKNTIFALAKIHNVSPIEEFGVVVTRHFVEKYKQVDKCIVDIVERQWVRMLIGKGAKQGHRHAFIKQQAEVRYAHVETKKGAKHSLIQGGIRGLKVLKTTGSGFVGFPKCEYTTLPEVEDRVMSTELSATWTFRQGAKPDYDAVHAGVRNTFLDVFANKYSKSVQQTIYDVGNAAIRAFPAMQEINMRLPNIHFFHYDVERFGLKNDDEIYYPTDNPAGYIEGTVSATKSHL